MPTYVVLDVTFMRMEGCYRGEAVHARILELLCYQGAVQVVRVLADEHLTRSHLD